MWRQVASSVATDGDDGDGCVPEGFHRQREERAVDVDRTLLRYAFAII